MPYTPHAHLSDSELILAVANKEGPTDLELELMERLVRLREDVLAACGYAETDEDYSAEEAIAGIAERIAA